MDQKNIYQHQHWNSPSVKEHIFTQKQVELSETQTDKSLVTTINIIKLKNYLKTEHRMVNTDTNLRHN